MPQYEGVVTGIKPDGRAEVVISPGEAGIPGAPHVNVCHCPSESSRIMTDALNRAGAEVGDVVSVTRKPGTLLKNAGSLLGIPLLGLLLGMGVAGALEESMALAWPLMVLVVVAGVLLGIFIGSVTYRRISGDSLPVVTEVVSKGREACVSLCGLTERSHGRPQVGCEGCIRR
jgi:hypothetical protein